MAGVLADRFRHFNDLTKAAFLRRLHSQAKKPGDFVSAAKSPGDHPMFFSIFSFLLPVSCSWAGR
jgi:hypothetical protein